jgi:GNAT superfamily N-acetyltransferase
VGLVDLRGREDDADVRNLLPRRDDRTGILIGWEQDGDLVACAAVERDERDLVLRALAVADDKRGRGIGRSLLDAVTGVATARRLVAETDDASVGFLQRCGFSVEELEPRGDGARFRCVRAIEGRPAAPDKVQSITLGDLEAAIRSSWERDTSDDPDEWSEDNPARGQCAVTALLVRDLLGGEILIANVLRGGERVERHSWNRLPSGLSVDLTRSQFRNDEEYEEPSVGEPLLVDRARYELLAERVRARL